MWKQPTRCGNSPPVDKQTSAMGLVCEWNGILISLQKGADSASGCLLGMSAGDVMLSEVSQSRKNQPCVIAVVGAIKGHQVLRGWR